MIMSKEKRLKALLVILALAFTFILVYSPHFNYRYPLHVDEWQHIAKAIYLEENGQIVDGNPYMRYWSYAPNLERGMTVFLSEFFMLTGLDPITHYRFLPALFATISAFILFVLVYSLTKEFYPALFSIIFFTALKSNINIMGLWFFTPLTFSFPFIFLTVLSFIKGMEEKDNLKKINFIFFFIVTFFIYPISIIFIFFIILFFLVMNPVLIRKNMRSIFIFAIIPLLFFAYFFNFFWRDSFLTIIKNINQFFVFRHGWSKVELSYILPYLYGIVPTLLAMIGLYPALKRKGTRFFIIWAIVSLALIYLFRAYSFTFIAPYQRMLYFCMLGMVPLSAMGFWFVIKLIKERFHNLFRRTKHYQSRIISGSAAAIFLFIVIAASFYNYYSPPEEDRIYHVLKEKDHSALLFIGTFEDDLVMAPLRISTAVYPIIKKHVVGMTEGNLPPANIDDVILFYEGDCEKKKEILKKYEDWYVVDIVLSEQRINCSFLEERFSKEDYVYYVLYEERDGHLTIMA